MEAKGRTLGWEQAIVNKAKLQAARLGSVTGTAATAQIASVAWFDRDGTWNAHLTDPPRRRTADTSYSTASILDAYYRPLVDAVASAQELQGQRPLPDLPGSAAELELTGAVLPDTDLVVAVPAAIFGALAPRTDTPAGMDRADAVGDIDDGELVGLARGVHDTLLAQRREAPRRDGASQKFHLGLDGVLVAPLDLDAGP